MVIKNNMQQKMLSDQQGKACATGKKQRQKKGHSTADTNTR